VQPVSTEELAKLAKQVHKVTPATLVLPAKRVAQAKPDRRERRAMQVLKVFWE
jgi:hypothetical protein